MVIMTMMIADIIKYMTIGCELTTLCVLSSNINYKLRNFVNLPIVHKLLLANSRADLAKPSTGMVLSSS